MPLSSNGILGGFPVPQNLTYRRATTGDRETLIRLGHTPSEVSEVLLARRGLRSFDSITIVCSTDAGDILGSVTGSPTAGIPDTWSMGYARVREDARGRGIGKALWKACCDEIMAAGGTSMLAYVRPSNSPSIAMILANGFSTTGWKGRVRWTTSSPLQSLGNAVEITQIFGRPALRRAATALDLWPFLSHMASWERPLGPFPPYLSFPQHDIRRVLRRAAPTSIATDSRSGRILAILSGDNLLVNNGVDLGNPAGHTNPVPPPVPVVLTVCAATRPALSDTALLDEWTILLRSRD